MKIVKELYRKSLAETNSAPTLMGLLQTGEEFYISVGGNTRQLLTADIARKYLSYLVYPTKSDYYALLATNEDTIVGVLEQSDTINNKNMELEVDLGLFDSAPKLEFNKIDCLNSLALYGSGIINRVDIISLKQCNNLFKIVTENATAIIHSQACSMLMKLYYCKGSFIMKGSKNFFNCPNLNNFTGIEGSYLTPECFSNCHNFREITFNHEKNNYAESEPQMGTNAINGCELLKFKDVIRVDNLVVFPQGNFEIERIPVEGNVVLVATKEKSDKTNLF